ncbi:hypothetical protein D9M71_843720 [compost metagenome]
MSPSTAQDCGCARTASQSWGRAACGKSPECHQSRMPKTLRPIEPNGTRPISTFFPESFSQSIEPSAMPTENTVRISVTTLSSPCSNSLA